MQASHRTQGATLLVSLLFVMLILAVVMGVTAQVTLSNRRSSADQQTLLSARYAAESGLARIQARLKVMGELLDAAKIPSYVGNSVIEAQLLALCGGVMTSPPDPVACKFNNSAGLNNSSAVNPKVGLFNLAIPEAEFAKRGFTDTSLAARTKFWNEMLSGADGISYDDPAGTYKVSFGLIPTELARVPGGYRLKFKVPSVAVRGQTGQTTQYLNARSEAAGDAAYSLLISRESFARYALFTNHHYQSAAAENNDMKINYTSRTLFSGPVHTNQRFLFHERPIFWGEVTSTGCPRGQIGLNPATNKPDCLISPVPGAFFGSSEEHLMTTAEMASTPGSSITAPVYNTNAPVFNSSVSWTAGFQELPGNSQDQQGAAAISGLSLTGDVQEMQLFREVIGGQEQQRIRYTQNNTTVDLAYGEDRLLYLLVNGQWVKAGRDANGNVVPSANQMSFNGVVSVRGPLDSTGKETVRAGIKNLNGGPNVAAAGADGASLASFAGITVATTADINITSSLKYTDPPCTGYNSEIEPAPCNNLSALNILGLYSSAGNINLISPNNPGSLATRLGVNPEIHAVLMASQGAVQVDGWNAGAADNSLGKVNLVGGVIENYYGAFGTVQGTGYGRNFVYDRRTYDGYGPPAFPTLKDWSIGVRVKDTDTKLADNGIRLQGDTVSARKLP